MPFIAISKLTKTFGSVVALEEVSLEVEPGTILGIMGANGAGKSTLLRILAGLVLPSSGSVVVAGMDAANSPKRLRRQIGFAAGERPGFYDRLTAKQNLEFFAALYGFFGRAARHRIGDACEQAGVLMPDKPYQELSTGMKQRLLLARTLLHDPQLLLLDEPTRSLDPAESERCYGLIRRLQGEGKTIIFTTHQHQDAAAVANRLVTLSRGRLEAGAAFAQQPAAV